MTYQKTYYEKKKSKGIEKYKQSVFEETFQDSSQKIWLQSVQNVVRVKIKQSRNRNKDCHCA